MSKTYVKLDKQAVANFMKYDAGLERFLKDKANDVAKKSNGTVEQKYTGKNRMNFQVKASNKDNSLLKGLR